MIDSFDYTFAGCQDNSMKVYGYLKTLEWKENRPSTWEEIEEDMAILGVKPIETFKAIEELREERTIEVGKIGKHTVVGLK